MTFDEMHEEMSVQIGAGRWTVEGVEAGPRTPNWVYTVGLIENFDHPELVATDGDSRNAAGILHAIPESSTRSVSGSSAGCASMRGSRSIR